jgi:predicted transport protein
MCNLYKELKASVLSISADISIKLRAKYIAFIRKTNFVDGIEKITPCFVFEYEKRYTQ